MSYGVTTFIRIIDWPDWPLSYHLSVAGAKRQWSAKEAARRILDLDKTACTAKFNGSAKAPYITTLNDCRCTDWIRTKKPCKHMYALAQRLGRIELYSPRHEWEGDAIVLNAAYGAIDDPCCTWGDWNVWTHAVPEQVERQERAVEERMTIELDGDADGLARINSYSVSLNTCTCPDFRQRQAPCKHIYRLALMSGLLRKDKSLRRLRRATVDGRPTKQVARELIATFVGSYAEGWHMCVPVAFQSALGIRAVPQDVVINDEVITQYVWMQTSRFCFDVGDIVYDTPLAYSVWSEALKHINVCYQVIEARPAVPAAGAPPKTRDGAKDQSDSALPRNPGHVRFKKLVPNNDMTILIEAATMEMSQDEFVRLLIVGPG